MVSVWYLLATLSVGATPINEKVSCWAFVLYILFINLAPAHHLLVDPQLSPASVEVAQRRHGFSKGLFEWLTKAPWGNPGFAALMLSLVLFGFMGGSPA